MYAEALSSDSLFDSAIERGPEILQPGSLVGGRFRIGSLLGEGGMSAVYLAHDERLARDVALKLLSSRIAHSREVVTRFVNEARTLARLESEHIVRVLDAGVTDDPEYSPLPYMVLELLHGEDLRSECERGPVECFDQAVGWILQVCVGLAVAHAEGVVHRDLKPENLFLTRHAGGSDVVKILDFGIARSLALPSQLTQSGEGVGSPGYMSPEQLNDASAVDERSDIWSLGVVLYELLAGVPPFHSNSTFELCAQILAGKPPRLSRFRDDLPRGLVQVVHRCLAVDPDARFSDIAELADALAPYGGALAPTLVTSVRQRLHTPSGPVLTLAERPSVDAQAPTEPAFDDEAMSRALVQRSRSRWRRAGAQSLGWLALAAMVTLLLRAFAPNALGSSAKLLSEARGSVERAGERLTAAARSALDGVDEPPK